MEMSGLYEIKRADPRMGRPKFRVSSYQETRRGAHRTEKTLRCTNNLTEIPDN